MTRATRPSRATQPFTGRRSRRQYEPDEHGSAYDAEKKARAEKLADIAAIHDRVAREETVFGKGDSDAR